MRLFATLILSVAFAQSVFAAFSSGSTFEATPYFGEVTVVCPSKAGMPVTTTFSCRKSVLSPREKDLFYGPAGVNGDRVSFTNRIENRTTRVKNESYDQLRSRTHSEVNLWQESLIQAPLLGMGSNQIRYQIYKGREQAAEGNFSVQVNRKNTVRCQNRQIFGLYPSDCENQVWACETYFESPNVCF